MKFEYEKPELEELELLLEGSSFCVNTTPVDKEDPDTPGTGGEDWD